MSTQVDPGLLHELRNYGAVGAEKCINCGNCTAICPLTTNDHPFPRHTIRMVQMGLREQLLANVDPWLCYFCGDCTKTCPRGAEPAETMMAARRWLIANYDQSGKAQRLYTSTKTMVWTIIRTAAIPLILLLGYHLLTGGRHIRTDQVVLNEFAPVMWVWLLVLLHFAYLGTHLTRNSLHMSRQFLGPETSLSNIPLGAYLTGMKNFAIHFVSQRQWLKCDETHKETFSRWRKHLLLMSGYVIMLILIVPLLFWFQTDNIYPIYNPQRWLGYYATVILVFTSLEILYSRIKKKEEIHRFSHHSDWLFPIFLLIGAITGIIVHIFRYMLLPWPTYAAYTVHIMVMVAMLDTEVGIGKWSHLIYRPLAMSLDAIQKGSTEPVPDASPAAAD
ncbi:MAG: 4Fe-4S dicluster domain-containing protein [Anaerolineales bacterium]|jgi:ferredoxin